MQLQIVALHYSPIIYLINPVILEGQDKHGHTL